MFNTFLSKPLWDNVEKYGSARQVKFDNIMMRIKDMLCMPDKSAKNKDTHITFNTYCCTID